MTSFRNETDPLRLLRHLIELDLAAAEGYRIAAERFAEPAIRNQLRSFGDEHRRRGQRLARQLEALGGQAPGPDAKIRVLPGMVTIADRRGDEAILLAMRNNEEGTARAFADALAHAPQGAWELVEAAAADEQHHVGGLEVALSDLRASASYRGGSPDRHPGAAPPR